MQKVLPFLFVLFLGCTSDHDDTVDHGIVGKWQLEATKISPGSIVDWSSVTNGEIYDFDSDGFFELSGSKQCNVPVGGTFTILKNRLSLQYNCNSQHRDLNYNWWFEDGKLILGFVGCIEECSYRFKRLD